MTARVSRETGHTQILVPDVPADIIGVYEREVWIDEGIYDLIQELWSQGVRTFASCQGGDVLWDGRVAYGYVALRPNNDQRRVQRDLDTITRLVEHRRWQIAKVEGGSPAAVRWIPENGDAGDLGI